MLAEDRLEISLHSAHSVRLYIPCPVLINYIPVFDA